MQREAIKYLDNMLRRDDFNCKNIKWREMKVMENAGQWSKEVLQLTMVNTMDQWVEESTRYRGRRRTIVT
ncbi:hypothetical protein E2C01_059867 [Portunus trituberculatus]|uniref:Uncharacterized protein n=1 Tax=Portunus trituberculatus TaxID=210409 RepID=A0A5B7GZK9_PORTR|nr:hypothetical protein [Portunus trituberculatus]